MLFRHPHSTHTRPTLNPHSTHTRTQVPKRGCNSPTRHTHLISWMHTSSKQHPWLDLLVLDSQRQHTGFLLKASGFVRLTFKRCLVPLVSLHLMWYSIGAVKVGSRVRYTNLFLSHHIRTQKYLEQFQAKRQLCFQLHQN